MKKKQTPDQIINNGICMISSIFGGAAGIICSPPAIGIFIGVVTGLVVGLILCKIRPKHGKAQGAWKHINHFILIQMDSHSAFSKKNKFNK